MITNSREWNSSAYHRVSNPQFEWGLKVLERLSLRGDERLMDAGCGSGRLTAKLVERLPQGEVVGVDLSHNMLIQAAEHLSDRIRFVQADLTHLPFDNEFDVIFSTASFHWVLDHPAMFASLSQSLRSGGKIEAQCGGGPNLEQVRRRIRTLMDSPKYASSFSTWKDPWEFADAEITAHRMTRAGFTDIETWIEPAAFKLSSEQEYRDFLPPVILRPFLNAIVDQDLRQQFEEDVVRQAADDATFELDYWRLNLRGRKG